MSNQAEDIVVNCPQGETYTLFGRPCELSAFSYVPKSRDVPIERTYFNTPKKERYSNSTYDRLYHIDYGFDQKLHRCDREHAKAKGLTVNDEERVKDVPTLASTIYGKKVASPLDPPGARQCEELDHPDRKHVRIAHVKTEFFRRNEIEGLSIEQVK